MGKIPIGVQLYSIRHACEADLPGSLEKVAEMGYDGVEFAGYYGRTAEQLKELLDDNGLKCCGTHTGITTLLGDELEKTVEFNKVIGNKYLVVPGLPEEYRNSRDAWLKTAETFSEIAERLKKYDMLTGYHNHHIEFAEMGGELPWDTFFSNVDPSVIMQVDVGNAMHGGGDPIPYVEKYPGRAITVHVKDYSEEEGYAPYVGEGDTDWEAFFELCETQGGTEWYIVEYEHENEGSTSIEDIAICLENLREMGK